MYVNTITSHIPTSQNEPTSIAQGYTKHSAIVFSTSISLSLPSRTWFEVKQGSTDIGRPIKSIQNAVVLRAVYN